MSDAWTSTFLGIIAVCAMGIVGTLVLMWLRFQPALSELERQLHATLIQLRQSLLGLDQLVLSLRDSGLIDEARLTLRKASGAAGRIDPLADDLTATLSNARGLIDDATQTSQSLRARVDDLAATQRELTELAGALAQIAGELRDRELAAKLENVLSDTSLLAADLGLLAQNANNVLDGGKPLLNNITGVVSGARARASGIGARLGSLREGLRAGVASFRESGDADPPPQ
jgi:methyl-accepting chemotaxis protein